MAELTQTLDHVTRALALLASSFADKPKFKALASIYLAEVQAAENALFQVLLDKRLSSPNCVGVLLDEIGKKIGQDRNGTSDALYRKLIAARQLANRSNGHVNDIYAVTGALGMTNCVFVLYPPKGFLFRLLDVVTAEEALYYADFLRRTREAGTNGQLEYILSPATAVLTCPGQIGYLTIAASIGTGTLNLGSTAKLPAVAASGGIISSTVLDGIAWTGKTSTTLTGVTGVTNTHAIGSAVYINDPAKGLGATRGHLAGVST